MIRAAARKLARGSLLAVLGLLVMSAIGLARSRPANVPLLSPRLTLLLPLATDRTGLQRFTAAVTNPSSPRYGQYASIGWLSRHFGASESSRGRVVTYLHRHGATAVRIDATGQFAQATMSAEVARRVFGAELRSHRVGDAKFPGPVGRTVVPRALRGVVTGVIGLDTPVTVRPAAAVPPPQAPSGYPGPDGSPQGCVGGLRPAGFAPNEYLDAYHYAALHRSGIKGQGERVALIEIDGFNVSDIRTFASCFGLNVPPIARHAVGVPRLLAAGGEATLDLEVLDAAAPRLKSIDVYEAEPDASDVLRALIAPLQHPGYKPNVISVSLGLCEADTLATVGRPGITATESALKEAAAAGISVLGASGDTGSAGCPSMSGNVGAPVPQLAVIFPASSPWVTAVGGINLQLNGRNQIQNQVVWNEAASNPGLAGGGGFSTLFSRPAYQSGMFAQNQRALPDVALLADTSPGYDVYCSAPIDCHGRGWVTFGGTSAATPLMAGGFALIDQLLRAADRQALGFANPLIYRLAQNPSVAPQIFDDVSSGSNDVGPFISANGLPLGCCSAGPGFDEASGWGGVDLLTLAQSAELAQPPVGEVTLGVPVRQHPLSRGGIAARIRCTRACEVTVRAKVTGAMREPFIAYAQPVPLRPRRTRLVSVKFSAMQVRQIQGALKRERPVTVAVTAALVDASGNIERQTRTLSLALTS